MIAIALCVAAFVASYLLGRKALWAGLAVVVGVGYFYGILRANLLQSASHFIFDASVVGLYLAAFTDPTRLPENRLASMKAWLLVLIGWPLVLFMIPLQDPLIQLVGLRGNAFLLPFLLIGAYLDKEDLMKLALAVAGLNLLASAFGIVEFFVGIEPFYPLSPVTELIYRSNDVASYRAHRIPATFSSAHAYAGTMVTALALLIGAWVERPAWRWQRLLIAGGIFVSVLGVFMAAARSHALVLFLVLGAASLSTKLRTQARWAWPVMLLAVVYVVSSDVRLQRFQSLGDYELVATRVAGSVNMRFLELASEYPLGNGLGGGGTSVPHFLQHRLRNPLSMENEYSRIVLEQGLPGLGIWTAFLIWLLSRGSPWRTGPWGLGRRLGWLTAVAYYGSGLIGVGLLTSIPQSALLFLLSGWLAMPPAHRATRPATEPAALPQQAAAARG